MKRLLNGERSGRKRGVEVKKSGEIDEGIDVTGRRKKEL